MKLPIETVAGALDLPVSKLARWIRQGSIPIQRSGGDVDFSTTTLQKWATTHQLPFSLEEDPTEEKAADDVPDTLDSLLAAMQRGKVCHGLTGLDACAALRSAVDCMGFLTAEIKDELFEKLIERERLASTGIGNGIAIPHPRDPLSLPSERPVISTCFLEKAVDFNAIDDQPVSVFFVLISPTVKQHLHLLSRLSYCIRDREFVAFLRAHPAAKDLYAQITGFEKQLDAI